MKKLSQKIIIVIIMTIFLSLPLIPATEGVITKNKSLTIENNFNNSDLIFNLKIRALMKIRQAPTLSACIIKNKSLVWYKGYGYYNLLKMKKASSDTIYLLGSLSKTIISTALMQLYEQGKFNLSDDVNDYLPFSLRNPNHPDVKITISMLLSHNSSLNDRWMYNPKGLKNIIPFPDELDPWLEEMLTPNGCNYIPELWCDFKPGNQSQYSSLGYLIISYLIELLSGQSIEEYCQNNVFNPLEMFNTSFHLDNLDRKRFAPLFCYPKNLPIRYRLPHYDLKALSPVGGIRCTTEDLSHFLIAHINNGMYNGKRILKNSTIELMHKIPDINQQTQFINYPFLKAWYGIGWLHIEAFNETFEGHTGAIYGCTSLMLYNRTNDIGVIYFINELQNMPDLEWWAFCKIGQLLYEKGKNIDV